MTTLSKRDLITRAGQHGCTVSIDMPGQRHPERTITITAPAGQHFTASGDHKLFIFAAENAEGAYAYAYQHLLNSLPLEPCSQAIYDCLQAAR
jgi:hypothetical protein